MYCADPRELNPSPTKQGHPFGIAEDSVFLLNSHERDMADSRLDEIDRIILRALQEDARGNTNAAISDRVSVSPSTVSKRITRLENNGIIRGYRTDIDYEQAGYPIHVLFICTASITEREALIQNSLDIDGVLDIRELMTGEENVHVRVLGTSNDDITRIARRLVEIGYTVHDEILMKNEYRQSSVHFTIGPQDE